MFSSKSKLKPKTPLTNLNSTKTAKLAVPPSASQASVRSSSSLSAASTTRARRSPKASSSQTTFGFHRPKQQPRAPITTRSSARAPPESPLAHHSRHGSAALQRSSDDSIEVDEVELLLAPPTPTPARTGTQSPRKGQGNNLQTPSRLPTRASLSYMSPVHPRSGKAPYLTTDLGAPANRGSILPWEQFANDSLHILDHGEMENILGDIPAPFTLGAPSPTTTNFVNPLGLGESPSLRAMNTPGGYESISQVFLPNVTPSPAIQTDSRLFQTSNDSHSSDSGTVTMLRLQVASAENAAKERLSRMQELEEELRAAQQARFRDVEDLAAQVASLTEQLRCSAESREKVDKSRVPFPASPPEKPQRAAEQALQDKPPPRKVGRREWATLNVSCTAILEWSCVLDQARSTLDYMKTVQETLNVILAGLDHSERAMLDGSIGSAIAGQDDMPS
ncbi:hypothetical protein SERLA73DRAFT_69871 [Serpula lacrymans var. lacrymans S7.3]|uniref:Uncharacterized protein n=2 Tax=Serpula lacrymans var. lacrymans TaxID=341189 RepID=F8PJE8_SERL3|nr:uncharacterized protein SERLADRAFT_433940 [Serpula lacrymans var. lacrymans S7.9]EGO04086.1 hypothetical protein SERLA73DRAFT_69871 [Serpula lacrymans var. lacrymans S7.3]EGO30005.1 hypothetical protein SERLADRAFT_433940 [Serpula lacrymans var. lacrymans S7.9]